MSLRTPIRWCFTHPLRAILLAIITAVVFFYAGLKWIEFTGRRRLAAVIAETEREWPSWTIEQLEAGRPKIPDDENSALVIARAYNTIKAANLPARPDTFVDFHDPAKLNQLISDADAAVLQEELAILRSPVQSLIAIKDMPRGYWTIKYGSDPIEVSLDELKYCRECAQRLCDKIELDLHGGHLEQGVHTIEAMFHIGDSLDELPFATAQHYRLGCHLMALYSAERMLAIHELPHSLLFGLERIVKRYVGGNSFPQLLQYERAMCYALHRHMDAHGLAGNYMFVDAKAELIPTAVLENLYWYRLCHDTAFLVERLNQAVRITTQPPHGWATHLESFEKSVFSEVRDGPHDFRHVISGVLWPACRELAGAANAVQARTGMLRLALSAERFRIDHQRWPKTLAELVPSYITELPIDPFSGKHFLHAETATGFIIYSVGVDGDDDGGVSDNHDDEKDDTSFRLWNADQRGLPAKVVAP